MPSKMAIRRYRRKGAFFAARLNFNHWLKFGPMLLRHYGNCSLMVGAPAWAMMLLSGGECYSHPLRLK
jgi:hypothetical protein